MQHEIPHKRGVFVSNKAINRFQHRNIEKKGTALFRLPLEQCSGRWASVA